MRVADIAAAIGGRCLGEGGRIVRGLSIDSRTIRPGEAFLALRGRHLDGHDFIQEAVSRGAVAAVVEREGGLPPDLPAVVVEDTRRALVRIAAAYRSHLGGISATVIAITGTNGKTTTKEMTYHILSACGPTVRARRSFNNDIGVPLTLLSIEPHHRWAVLEMGTSAPGEIAALAEVARPEVGVVTSIGEAHLEGLGDREGVARAKGELVAALPSSGWAVLNADDPLCAQLADLCRGRVLYFGFSPRAEVRVEEVRQTEEGVEFRLDSRRVRLRLLGLHNALNAAAAVGVCRLLGLRDEEIFPALETFTAVPMRLCLRRGRGVAVLDDSYNANPQSMRAAVEALVELKVGGGEMEGGRRVMVCGDMCELGEASERLHRRLGEYLAGVGLDFLVTVGCEEEEVSRAAVEAGFPAECVRHFADARRAASGVPDWLRRGDVVLVKGSRAMGLERVVRALLESDVQG